MIQTVLAQAVAAARPAAELGQTASYIPELSKVDKHQLGACVFTADGGRFSAGDTKVRFSIQSISKVISLAAALELCGFETVFAQVGMEPSGDAFNAMGKLEAAGSSPSNPMINAGAIVDHDVTLMEGVHVAPGAIVKAGATVPAFTKVESGQIIPSPTAK